MLRRNFSHPFFAHHTPLLTQHTTLALQTQIGFSYFVVIKKMTQATYTLYDADPTEYDFGVLGVLEDSHNFLYIAALWLGSGLIYFLDMQIW